MERPAVYPTKILLVEDNTGDIELIKEALKTTQLNYDIHVAKDGVEAVEYLNRAKTDSSQIPDIIFLDLNLPKLDGYGVLIQLKSDGVLRKIPVTVFTSSESE